MGNRLLVSISI